MAIYHNGIQMNNLYHNGKKIWAIYHNGVKIFHGKYDAGTVLATVGKSIAPNSSTPFGTDIGYRYNEHFVSKGTFPFDISKIDNGIQINSSRKDDITSQLLRDGGSGEIDYGSYPPTWINPIKISKSDLIAGKKVEISKGAGSSSRDYIPVYALYRNGSLSITGHFGCTTCCSSSVTGLDSYASASYGFMRIDSITTY